MSKLKYKKNPPPKRDFRTLSDSITNANKELPWVKRYLEGNKLSIPDVTNSGKGYTSSHALQYDPTSGRVWPSIVQQGDSLVYLSKPDEAYNYAEKNNTFIQTDPELAKFYSENGLIDHTKINKNMSKNKYATGGKTPPRKNIPEVTVKPNSSKYLFVDDENDPRYKAYQDSLKFNKVTTNLLKVDDELGNMKDAFYKSAEYKKWKNLKNGDESNKYWRDNLADKYEEFDKNSSDLFYKNNSNSISNNTLVAGNIDAFRNRGKMIPLDFNKFYNNIHNSSDEYKYAVDTNSVDEIYNKPIHPSALKFSHLDYIPIYDKPTRKVFVKGSEQAKLAKEQEQLGVPVDGIDGPITQAARSKQPVPEPKPQYDPNEALYYPSIGGKGWGYHKSANSWISPKNEIMSDEEFRKANPGLIPQAGYNEQLPEYGLGGWINENKEGIIGGLKMAGGAALIATGVGAGAGAGLIASGVGDMAGELSDGNQSNDAALAQKQQIMAAQNAQLQGGIMPQPTFAAGGVMPGMAPTAELEKEEVTMGPDGSMAKMDLPSHAQGGGNVPLEPGTKVYSDKYKPQGSKLTYAEEADLIRKQIKKLEKKLYA